MAILYRCIVTKTEGVAISPLPLIYSGHRFTRALELDRESKFSVAGCDNPAAGPVVYCQQQLRNFWRKWKEVNFVHATFFWNELLSHWPFAQNLAHSNYFLLTNLKKRLDGKRFGSNNEITAKRNAYFGDLDITYYLDEVYEAQRRLP